MAGITIECYIPNQGKRIIVEDKTKPLSHAEEKQVRYMLTYENSVSKCQQMRTVTYVHMKKLRGFSVEIHKNLSKLLLFFSGSIAVKNYENNSPNVLCTFLNWLLSGDRE